MTAYSMFAGELQGQLETCHIAHRARDVRDSIAKIFLLPLDDSYPPPMRKRLAAGWRAAQQEGWRVVAVVVQKR